MYAHKIRRDEDYVIRPVRADATGRGPVPISGHTLNLPSDFASPARLLQERLVEEMALAPRSMPDERLSPVVRWAVIIAIATACWLPFVGLAALVFG